MPQSTLSTFDARLDLTFNRVIDIAPHWVWQAWTTPDILKQWFCPAPWTTIDCDIDLRPGGRFFTVMRSPEGQEFLNTGCYLDLVADHKLVWTNALEPDYRPAQPLADEASGMFFFTASITLEPAGNGTKYTARVIHGNEEDRQKHAAMGFEAGWGMALDQLVATMKSLHSL